MKYNKGERVKHPTKDDWGLGEVIADSDGGSVRVFFVDAGEKTISLDIIQPIQVAGVEAAHPVLDNLRIDKSASGIKYQSLAESVQFFLKEYPEGFYGGKYKKDERDYKFKAHKLALELLDKEAFQSLLTQQDYLEIRKRALRVINKTNIISQYEKMSLNNGKINYPAASGRGINMDFISNSQQAAGNKTQRDSINSWDTNDSKSVADTSYAA